MSEKTPIKVGIWGLGRAGYGMHTNELKKYSDEFTVVAACDIDAERFDKLHERFPEAATYTDGDAFLADPREDAPGLRGVRLPLVHLDRDENAAAVGVDQGAGGFLALLGQQEGNGLLLTGRQL